MKRTIKAILIGGTLAVALFATAGSAEAAAFTVRSGDTLSKLFPHNWQSVCAHNALPNCNLIYVGQVLGDGAGASTSAVAGVSTSQPAQVAPAGNRFVPTGSVLGKPYVYGANGPYAFDCSSLTQYLAGQMGYSIPRNSYGQAAYGRSIGRGELWPGDLVIMNGAGHVGMFIGGNQIVHALNPAQDVQVQDMDYVFQWNPVLGYRAVGH
ncbi:MAG: LysM peptidoglycan-binding domain-containing C40 family peptidase [Chloroflexia bacterium]|nr:LysM peptidoglycan-binding domain-containing C40 family peptidase [Chloroflexia bacterium]